jgi:multidrug efflux pump subunit AcrA (membrane-fusion protein)
MDDTQPHNPHTRENVGHPGGRSLLLIALIIGLVLVALLIAGIIPRQRRVDAAEDAAKAERESLPTVLVSPARRAPAVTQLLLPGDITPLTEASIYARSSGYVKRRLVDIGDHVSAGQLLAVIEAPDLDQQVAQARAAVAQAQEERAQSQSQLQQGKAQLELARVTRDRYATLVQKGALSRQDGDTQETNFQTSQATVNAYAATVQAAEANVRAAQASLDRLLALQGYEEVTAPFAGIITARLVEQGYFISATGGSSGPAPMGLGGSTPGATPGASGGGELFRLAQIGTLRILLNVPQTDAAGIHVGQDADVLLAEFPGHPFAGRVTRTASSLDINSRTLLTEVQVPNPQATLLPGMFAQVRLSSSRPSPPVLIPGDAVIAGTEGLSVAVLRNPPLGSPDGAKQIHIERIEQGRDNGTQVEVTHGLQGWEYVVLNPSDAVREGALVRPTAAAHK